MEQTGNPDSCCRLSHRASARVDDALLQLKEAPFEDLGFAKIDHHRALRQGAAEVIYGAGKTPEQIAENHAGHARPRPENRPHHEVIQRSGGILNGPAAAHLP